MLDETTVLRSAQLLKVFEDERDEPFKLTLGAIDAKAAATGAFRSSGRVLTVHNAFKQELAARCSFAWQSLYRSFGIQGSPSTETLREDLKSVLFGRMKQIYEGLESELQTRLSKTGEGLKLSLADALKLAISKHEVEIDLSVDAMTKAKPEAHAAPAQYNFYAAVGSVQTGDGSISNVIQHLPASDREALVSALSQIRDAILAAEELQEMATAELASIAEDCTAELSAKAPNGFKLSALLSSVGQAVQTLGSVQPAYAALKVAALAVGVVLP